MYHSLGNNAFILRINLFDQDFMDSNNSLQEMHPQHSFFVYDKHFLKFSLIHLLIHSKTVTEYLFWTMLNTGNTTETKKQIKKKKNPCPLGDSTGEGSKPNDNKQDK